VATDLDLLPASNELADVENTLNGLNYREFRLRHAIDGYLDAPYSTAQALAYARAASAARNRLTSRPQAHSV
jgi:hypothetical protein